MGRRHVPGERAPAGVPVASRRKADTTIWFVVNYDDDAKTVSIGPGLVDVFT
jgi:hypothetical protein